MTSSAWPALLDRVRGDIPALLADFLDELAHLDGYATTTIPRDDIERTAVGAFDIFLARLGDTDDAERSAKFAGELGRKRARQGMRIDQFMEGVRINFRVLWRALHRAADPDLVDELVSNGERILGVVERYATEVQAAFLEESQLMAQQRRTARERALARVFASDTGQASLAAAAELLGLRADAIFELVAFPGADDPRVVATAQAWRGALLHIEGDTAVLFREREVRAGVEPDGFLSQPGARITEVRGVAALARAAGLARSLLSATGSTTPASLREGLAPLLRTEATSLVAGFEHELVGGWYAAPTDERERLAKTARAFVRSGSIQATADDLFVHRNTIFKRLRAFTTLTGLDLTVPRDAAIALLVLPIGPARVSPSGADPAVSE
ncbi:MAG: helix-turn-helix domain-containing protein [Leucobacter sp.]